MNERILYRNDRRHAILGVCRGIAEFLGLPAWVVRILAILLLFSSFGAMLVAYIVLALVLPTKSQLIAEGRIVDDFQ